MELMWFLLFKGYNGCFLEFVPYDLFERKPQVTQGDDPVQTRQLLCRVIAVAGEGSVWEGVGSPSWS
jgi:hypothetical protein